jgi:dipeptidyl aminopeptidase/acylaminoacyl peptidase
VNDQQIAALLAAAPQEPEPPLPPGLLEGLVPAARRDVRRRRATAALCAVVALLLGAGALLIPAGNRDAVPARPSPGKAAGLPDLIAGYSPLTGSVSAAPPGRALLLYGYGNSEMLRTYQTLVLGADADVYRQLDAVPERTKPWLLSPDGRTIVLSEPDREVAEVRVVDLETGQTRQVPVPRPGGVVPLALSPDGNILAYSVVDLGPVAEEAARDAGDYVEWYATGHGELMLLDLRTGQATGTGVVPVSAAAFAPDGQRLVVQSELRTWLIGLDGQRQREVMVPQGYGITVHNAWSPSGLLLAVVPWRSEGIDSGRVYMFDSGTSGAVRTVSIAEPSALRGTADTETFLGWLSDTEVLGHAWDYGSDTGALSAVPLDGSPARVLSRFDDSYRCEFGMQRCVPYEISVAAGLLPGLGTRTAESADRGPWPVGFQIAALATVAVLAAVVWLVRRRVRRRRVGEAIS